MTFNHETVLLEEAVAALKIKPGGTYVDCTLGGGGHTSLILESLTDEKGRVIAFDQDELAISHAEDRFQPEIASGKLKLIHENFAHLDQQLNALGIEQVDGVLYDLGVSSPQFDEADRGFSYQLDARLDMRMDQRQELTAYDIVNTWEYDDLVRIFFRYGQEKFSKAVARKIEQERRQAPIETTGQLVEVIKEAIPAPARRTGGHPAKRIFQALRIAVNNELEAVERSLEQAIDKLAPGGRLSVISFHSLEDRLVKQVIQEYATGPELPPNLPILPEQEELPPLKRITRKPIAPSAEEVADNRRSRSAKLRVAEKQTNY